MYSLLGHIVKDIPTYEDKYAITEDGSYIIDKERMKPIYRWIIDRHGYKSWVCQLHCPKRGRKHHMVHRLVLSAWVGLPVDDLRTEVNHIDGNGLNNHYSNLEWCTKAENQRHAVDTGLKGSGERLYNASLTNEEAHQVCQLLEQGKTPQEVSDQLGAKLDIVRKIKYGDMYFNIRNQYNIHHDYKINFSEETVRKICEEILRGTSDANVAKKLKHLKVSTIQVKRIRHKIRYREISDEYF